MAQFDVHANTGQNKSAIPFVVVQSSRFDDARTRLVVALPRGSLGQVVASLADDASNGAIINAIDAAINRAYG